MKTQSRFSVVERNDILKKSQECLWTTEGKPALQYLTETRKLSEDVIRLFCLGYIPANVNHQLAGRIILPVYDPSNNLVSISSRAMSDDSFLPVYWHEAYEKSWYLYGLQNAKASMVRWKFAIIVEGQFDVLQLHNHGMSNAVGISGTNLSEMHIAMIHRYCEEIIVLLDRDSNQSGQIGVQKILRKSDAEVEYNTDSLGEITAPTKLNHKIIALSFNEDTDPDLFIRQRGIIPLKQMIRKTVKELRSKHVY